MDIMSKLLKFNNGDCPIYVNPDCVYIAISDQEKTILKTKAGQIYVNGDLDDIVARLNGDTEKVEQPEQLNVNNVLIYNGKIYQAVKDKICSACAFYEKGKACDDNRERCTDQQIHFRKVTQHE